MNTSSKALALLVGGAFVASVASTVTAAENPFAVKTLTSGYMVADAADTKMKDGKCSAGKCGATKKKDAEGKCSADKKDHEGKCSADKKGQEGKCSAEHKDQEGKCSADKK